MVRHSKTQWVGSRSHHHMEMAQVEMQMNANANACSWMDDSPLPLQTCVSTSEAFAKHDQTLSSVYWSVDYRHSNEEEGQKE